MDNIKYARQIGLLYEKVLSLHNDSEYVINQPQMDKFVKVLNFFKEEALRLNGEIDQIDLIPRMCHGGLTASFPVFSMNGESQIKDLCDVLQGCSAFGFEALPDGNVSVDCTIPDVFVKQAK